VSAPTSVSRRVEHCIQHLQRGEIEGALVDLFPAIDKTAKRRYPKHGVSKRIKGFIRDEEVVITAVGIGNILKGNVIAGRTFEEAIYEFGRTSIAHEGELDPRLSFDPSGGLEIGRDHWNLPAGYIDGLVVAVVLAPENVHERLDTNYGITALGRPFSVNSSWGKRDEMRKHICARLREPHLFD